MIRWWYSNLLDSFFKYLPKKRSKKLYVFFHGAVNQDKTVLPHFVGVGFRKYLDGSTLHFADETLLASKTIRSGFYMGIQSDLAEEIKGVITDIYNRGGYSQVIVFGSSAGGFIALKLAELLQGCSVVVNSPATSVANHSNKKIRDEFFSSVVRLSGLDECSYFEARRSCLFENFCPLGSVRIIVSVGDELNNRRHLVPFLKQFGRSEGDIVLCSDLRINENLTLTVRDFGQGHKYPPVPFLIDVLRDA